MPSPARTCLAAWLCLLAAGAHAQTIGQDEERRALEREAEQQRRLQTRPDVRLTEPDAPPPAAAPLPSAETPCFPIRRVSLSDVSGAPAPVFAWVLDALGGPDGQDAPMGRCLGARGVAQLIDRAQQALLARGYVTTRVFAPAQDLGHGELALQVLPGRIRAIRFAPQTSTGPAASTVGAISGNVDITAGQTYRQTGSDVLAPGGDVNIQAQVIQITEARITEQHRFEEKTRQSGLSIGVGGGVIEAAQGVAQTLEAVGETQNTRMKALGIAAAGLRAKGAIDSVNQALKDGKSPTEAAGVSLNIGIGSSKSQSTSQSRSDSTQGSTIQAGGDVNLIASTPTAHPEPVEGAGNILVRGSEVSAGNTVRLSAEGDIELVATQNATEQSHQNSSKSGSIGVGVRLGSQGAEIGVTIAASKGKGQGAGEETTYTPTRIEAGELIQLDSGQNTTLQGAVVQAEQVQANVGGDLKIESLQDTSTYRESSQQAGGSLTIDPSPGGSISVGGTRIDSDYLSVNEQSGIRAGDGGFQVEVQGQTELRGGAITSAQAAIDNDRNEFNSEGSLTLSDIQNRADYSADGSSIGIGRSEGKPAGGIGFGSDSGSASSVTQAAISGIAGNTGARTGEAESGITPIFDQERVREEVNAQITITAEFGKQASKAVGDYATRKYNELKDSDPEEAAKWAEGGFYRSLAHAAIGGLAGGATGAAGAGVAALAADALNTLTQDLPQSARSVVGAAVAAGIGAAAGGTTGAATAFTADLNNRQLHPSEIQWIKDNAKRFAEQQSISEIEAEKRLAQQAFRQVQFGVEGVIDTIAQAFLRQAGQQLLPGDLFIPGQNVGYMFYATPEQKANPNMYAVPLVQDPVALDFYAQNGLVQPSTANLLEAAARDTNIRQALGEATVGAAALAVGATMPTALSWCLANPVACNRIVIGGGEIAAGDALGPAGLGVLGVASAAKAVKSADEVNAAMKARGWEPAWSPGTPVIETTLQPGTKVSMIIDAKTAEAIQKGDPFVPGGWATFDDVSSVAVDMRQKAAITNQFKKSIDGPFFVVEMEITKSVTSNVGFVGKQTDITAGLLRGGGTQVQFDETIRGVDRSIFMRPTSLPKILN